MTLLAAAYGPGRQCLTVGRLARVALGAVGLWAVAVVLDDRLTLATWDGRRR